MIRRAAVLVAASSLAVLAFSASPAMAAEEPCTLPEKAECYGVESLSASLSTSQAGGHPDLGFEFDIKRDPESDPNTFGLKDAFAPTRNVRVELPPGLIGDPSVLGAPQQCTALELAGASDPGGGCPNASQIGRAQVFGYELNSALILPIYMMEPPGGDVVARVGISVPGAGSLYIDGSVRTESDYGLDLEVVDAITAVKLLRTVGTTWGVPAAEAHDTERCTPVEVLDGCVSTLERDPGGRELPFLTNPTRCGVPLEMRVGAASWVEPERFDFASASFPQITGCNKLPYGPGLTLEPTNRRAEAPTGLDITARLPASELGSFEPAQTRDVRVRLAEGITVNSSAADGLATCSESQVRFGQDVAANCPDAAKVADFEAEIPALPRRVKGALYLREPEPGNLFRVWIVADDQGIHVKLQGQMHLDESTGQIETVILDAPQAPLREMKIVLKSGFRAPLTNPPTCGSYASEYEFTPWSGGPPVRAVSPIEITHWKEPGDKCGGIGGFSPRISAGAIDPTAGAHSPFVFTLTREDGEQNPASLEARLPRGIAATLAGVARCDGAGADTGQCPAASRIGHVIAAAGAGPAPLWVPQPGKRPTAVYLGGPYKGAPLSVVAVVPAQAGPFDLGDEVVRSAIHIDPATAQATVRSDALPQIIEGVPVRYRTARIELDRPNFSLNPTGCKPRVTEATVTSTAGAVAHPSAPFNVVNCARLAFKPRLGMRLFGGTRRGAHPSFRAVLRPRPGHSNIAGTVVRLPRTAFLDQAHIRTVCTRVQYAADECPPGSVYGHARAFSPLLDEVLEGPVYLRSSSNPLPDMVVALRGLIDVEAVGRIDSVNGGIRATFDAIPDAPISKAIIQMQGGKKGLIVNSRNICKLPGRALVQFDAHNGREHTLRPLLQASCGKKQAK